MQLKIFKTLNLNFKPPQTLKNWRLWVLTRNNFSINFYLLMEIYITSLLQILSFFSRFRRFEMTNHGSREFYKIGSPPPHNFFHFYGPDYISLEQKFCALLFVIETRVENASKSAYESSKGLYVELIHRL